MPAIRRHVHIAASPRAVWKALTTPEGLESWLSDSARIEPRMGGRVVLTRAGPEGEPREDRGLIHIWRPISHLEIAFDRQSQGPSASIRVSFQVAQDGDEVRLALVLSGEPLDDEERHEKADQEWRAALAALQAALDAPQN